jgi:hypothetical protein
MLDFQLSARGLKVKYCTDLTEMHSTRLLGQRPVLAFLSPFASLVELG